MTTHAGITGSMEMRRGNAHPLSNSTQTYRPDTRNRRQVLLAYLLVVSYMHIHDPINHLTFLIDTGAVVSVLPPTATDRKFPQPHFHFAAANGSKIFIFGRHSLTLNLGLRRSWPWVFMIAEVQTPIIGADFLHHFNLSVGLNKRTLVDNTTDFFISGPLAPSTSPTLTLPPPPTLPSDFTALLADFPVLTQPHNYLHQPAKHNVAHSISTSGQPVAAKARRLAPERLRAAKKEFQHMLDLGIIQPGPFLSTWSPKSLGIGDHVEIIAVLIRPQSPTGTPFLTCMIFLHLYRVPPSSPSWT